MKQSTEKYIENLRDHVVNLTILLEEGDFDHFFQSCELYQKNVRAWDASNIDPSYIKTLYPLIQEWLEHHETFEEKVKTVRNEAYNTWNTYQKIKKYQEF